MTKTINEDVKRPSLWFGVEIEVCAATNPERHLKSLDFDHWINEPDISIFPPGKEFISPIFEWENRSQVFDVVETLQAHGAHCNQTCGLHIHMSGLFPEWNKSLEKYFEAWYEKVKSGFRSSRQRRRRYCTGYEHYDAHRHFINRVAKDSNRHHIEIRIFNAHLCKRWVARCLWEAKNLGESLEAMARNVA